jgi:hypothetical protein
MTTTPEYHALKLHIVVCRTVVLTVVVERVGRRGARIVRGTVTRLQGMVALSLDGMVAWWHVAGLHAVSGYSTMGGMCVKACSPPTGTSRGEE